MQEIALSASPLLTVAALGPLILGVYVRMGQVEAQLRALEDSPDSHGIDLVAGCMIRSRSCRAALLAFCLAGILASVLTLANLAGQILGWSWLELTPIGLLIASGFIALALILVSVEALMSLEPVELISRRKLNAARSSNN